MTEEGLTPQTRRLYAGDWAAFRQWCRGNGASALPASPQSVLDYLGSLTGLGPGALGRRLAAIAAMHRAQGLPSPGRDPAIRAFVRDARRARASAPPRPERRLPRAVAALQAMAAACPGDLAGLRDRAMLLLAAAGMRPADVLVLDADMVRPIAGGVQLSLHPQPMMRDGALGLCPVRALEDWMRVSDCVFGPVFRKVDRWGNIEHERMGEDAIRRIWRRRAGTRLKPATTAAGSQP